LASAGRGSGCKEIDNATFTDFFYYPCPGNGLEMLEANIFPPTHVAEEKLTILFRAVFLCHIICLTSTNEEQK
jgi:hypothetical protein